MGKTTVVHQFAKRFDQYIYLNLELSEDRRAFENYRNLEHLRRVKNFEEDIDTIREEEQKHNRQIEALSNEVKEIKQMLKSSKNNHY